MNSLITPSIAIRNAVHSRQRSREPANDSSRSKRKRKQWSIKEKLSILNTLEKISATSSLLLIGMVVHVIRYHNGVKQRQNLKHHLN